MKREALNVELRERIASRLAEHGQRLTPGRTSLVRVLAAARRPLTIPEVVDRDHTLAVSSVYRNLTDLEAAGVVHRLLTDGEFAYYELADDLTGHHHHVVCSNCGSIDDIEVSPELEQSVLETANDLARRIGFRTERHLIDLIGVCKSCA